MWGDTDKEEWRRGGWRGQWLGAERDREGVAGRETDAPALLVMLAVVVLAVWDRRGRRTSQHFTLLSPPTWSSLCSAGFNPFFCLSFFIIPTFPLWASSFSSILSQGPLSGLSQTWRLCPVLEAEGDDSPPCLVFLQPAAKLSWPTTPSLPPPTLLYLLRLHTAPQQDIATSPNNTTNTHTEAAPLRWAKTQGTNTTSAGMSATHTHAHIHTHSGAPKGQKQSLLFWSCKCLMREVLGMCRLKAFSSTPLN